MYVCVYIYIHVIYIYDIYIHTYIYILFTRKTLQKAMKNHQKYIQTNTSNTGIIFSEILFKNGGIISPTHS